jgi:hypothetical protein
MPKTGITCYITPPVTSLLEVYNPDKTVATIILMGTRGMVCTGEVFRCPDPTRVIMVFLKDQLAAYAVGTAQVRWVVER